MSASSNAKFCVLCGKICAHFVIMFVCAREGYPTDWSHFCGKLFFVGETLSPSKWNSRLNTHHQGDMVGQFAWSFFLKTNRARTLDFHVGWGGYKEREAEISGRLAVGKSVRDCEALYTPFTSISPHQYCKYIQDVDSCGREWAVLWTGLPAHDECWNCTELSHVSDWDSYSWANADMWRHAPRTSPSPWEL